MSRKVLVAGVGVALLLVLLGFYLVFSGDRGAGEGGEPIPTYTPPPLSEDPPMSGSDIDAVLSEVEQRDGRPKGETSGAN